MSEKTVWAYKPLKELNGETGFVSCDEKLADKLIASGDAQDPRIGASQMLHIQHVEYSTKDLRSKPPKAS